MNVLLSFHSEIQIKSSSFESHWKLHSHLNYQKLFPYVLFLLAAIKLI